MHTAERPVEAGRPRFSGPHTRLLRPEGELCQGKISQIVCAMRSIFCLAVRLVERPSVSLSGPVACKNAPPRFIPVSITSHSLKTFIPRWFLPPAAIIIVAKRWSRNELVPGHKSTLPMSLLEVRGSTETAAGC